MIAEENQVTRIPEWIHASTGVGHEEHPRSQGLHYSHGESHLGKTVSLVPVKPALHGHDIPFPQTSKQKAAGVTLHGGKGKAWDLIVGNGCLDREVIRQPAESGAENDSDVGPDRCALTHHAGCGL